MESRTLRTLSAVAIGAMIVTACGQKPGIHVDGGGLAVAQGQPDTATTTGAGAQATGDAGASGTTGTTTGSGGGSGAATGTASGGTTAGASTSTSSGGATAGSSGSSGGSAGTQSSGQASGSTGGGESGAGQAGGGSSGQSSGGQRQVRGSDRTGVTADEIVVASHAPVTGAAPLPTTSFEKSGDLYWRNLTERQGKTVLGRSKVSLIFRDDKYDPNSARQVCRELEAKAFTVSGGGGTDQIQACGQFAKVAQFPYFSAGVTEAGLRDNPWYFAASMSYRQQGLLLAQMATKRPETRGKKVAAIITDTPNFDDAVAGWEEGVAKFGVDYFKTLRHPKGDTSWYNSFVRELVNAGVEVVYPLTSPVDYIRFAQQATQQGADFQYIGVGISMGLNAVLGSGCPHVDGGLFFSPFPGLDWARKNVPEFFEAADHFNVPNDDIALALWGTNEVFHTLLERYGATYGNDLTREDFRDLVESSAGVTSRVFPELNYSPDNHFGSRQVHLLKADCSVEEYRNEGTFISQF